MRDPITRQIEDLYGNCSRISTKEALDLDAQNFTEQEKNRFERIALSGVILQGIWTDVEAANILERDFEKYWNECINNGNKLKPSSLNEALVLTLNNLLANYIHESAASWPISSQVTCMRSYTRAQVWKRLESLEMAPNVPPNETGVVSITDSLDYFSRSGICDIVQFLESFVEKLQLEAGNNGTRDVFKSLNKEQLIEILSALAIAPVHLSDEFIRKCFEYDKVVPFVQTIF